MRSPSIEFFHTKIEKLIRLAQSYTDIDTFGFIIKACRLKPYSYVFERRTNNIVLYRWWFDEFGNSLNIIKNKRIRLTFNDLRLDKKKIISTDLYYGLSMDQVAKISKLVYICAGKDEDLYQDCYLVSFLGIDEHLRTYLYWFGEWQQVSPLLMGMKHLKLLAANRDIKYFRTIGNTDNIPIPCISGRTWLSYLPPSKDFLDIIRKQHELLLPILEGK
jgi:hypothetical protein